MAESGNTKREDALKIVDWLREQGVNPYPEKFDKQITVGAARNLDIDAVAVTAGRIIGLRDMGKLAFADIQDFSGKFACLSKCKQCNEECKAE